MSVRGVRVWVMAGAVGCLVLPLGVAEAQPSVSSASTTRASVSSGGEEGNNHSFGGVPSGDGRFVAFTSDASNLVAGDTNASGCPVDWSCSQDVFVRDQVTKETNRVSVASDGGEAHSSELGSFAPDISADGRFVVFESLAYDLVPGVGGWHVYVHDRLTGETSVVSKTASGVAPNGRSEAPSISADGLFVAFLSEASNLVAGDTNDVEDVFRYDRTTGQTQRVTVASSGAQANDWSNGTPSISGDGRYIAFDSMATNLVPGSQNGTWNVYLHDMSTNVTQRISQTPDGAPANGSSAYPAISANGKVIAFGSQATNLGPSEARIPPCSNYGAECDAIFAYDRDTNQMALASVDETGRPWPLTAELGIDTAMRTLSADGRYLVMSFHLGGVYVRDLENRVTQYAAKNWLGTRPIPINWRFPVPYGASISLDGRHLVFASDQPLVVADDTTFYADPFDQLSTYGIWDVFVRSAATVCANDCTLVW